MKTIEKIGIDRSIEINRNSFYKILLINPLASKPTQDVFKEGIEADAILLTHSDNSGFNELKI